MGNKDTQTQEILSHYLADIITKTSEHDSGGLSHSLQSVISPAISKEIADNKDTMIDALYPIMGGMISKYVTQAIKEMMENINKKIEDGLSTDRIKRKVKAKLSGVSETELLLEESGDARILSMFVIHKETSLLIAEAYLEDQKIDDAHMVASMASAIKDFINDWIENNETNNEVQLLSYGNATLYIESAGSVFVVAFLDSEPDHTLRKEINTFFASLLTKYADFFQEFEGDDSAEEIKTLSSQLSQYLNAQEMIEEKKKSNTAKYILYFLTALLLGYGLYLISGWYKNYTLESEVYKHTGEEVSITLEDETLLLQGQVASMENITKITNIAKMRSENHIDNRLLVPMTYLDERFKSKRDEERYNASIEERIGSLERSISTVMTENKRLVTQLEDTNIYLENLLKGHRNEISELKSQKQHAGEVLRVKKELVKALDNTFKDNPYYDAKTHALDFRDLNLFYPGSVVHQEDAIMPFEKTFENYVDTLAQYKEYLDAIIIEGHSDSSGLEEENIKLSETRALSIKHYVETLKSVKEHNIKPLLFIKAYGSSQAVISGDGIEDKQKSRRIMVKFQLSNEKIVNKLGSILND